MLSHSDNKRICGFAFGYYQICHRQISLMKIHIIKQDSDRGMYMRSSDISPERKDIRSTSDMNELSEIANILVRKVLKKAKFGGTK